MSLDLHSNSLKINNSKHEVFYGLYFDEKLPQVVPKIENKKVNIGGSETEEIEIKIPGLERRKYLFRVYLKHRARDLFLWVAEWKVDLTKESFFDLSTKKADNIFYKETHNKPLGDLFITEEKPFKDYENGPLNFAFCGPKKVDCFDTFKTKVSANDAEILGCNIKTGFCFRCPENYHYDNFNFPKKCVFDILNSKDCKKGKKIWDKE